MCAQSSAYLLRANLRCVRQTNDVILLHKMLCVFDTSSSSLNEDEFDLTQTMTAAIRVRLDELHCQCLECIANACDDSFESFEQYMF